CLCARFQRCMVELGDDLSRALIQRSCTASRPGTAEDPARPLNIAQRVLASCNIGPDDRLRRALEDLTASQLSDGSWPAGPFYSLGKRALYFGSNAVTTMFVTKALGEGIAVMQRRAALGPGRGRRLRSA